MAAADRGMPRKRAVCSGMVRSVWMQPLNLLPLGTRDFYGLKRPQSALSESEQALVPCQRQTLVELPVGAPDNPELSIPKGHPLALNERKRLQAAPPDAKPAAQNDTQDDASAFRPVAVLRIGGAELSLTNGVSSRLVRQLKELLGNAEGR